MKDIQSTPAQIAFPIDRVGVKGLKFPIQVQTRDIGMQHTVAIVDMGVDLSVSSRGTHMSRFVEVLQDWNEPLCCESLERLVKQTQQKLQSQHAYIAFFFPYFLHKRAPSTNMLSLFSYDCKLSAKSINYNIEFILELTVPVMTVCPCSKAISHEGAHSQRSEIYIQLRLEQFRFIEDFIVLAESSASSPLYSLLKRADEKYVTEDAFAHPKFVEDVVRNISSKLITVTDVLGFRVEVESFESIHAHNAFAYIEHEFIC